MTSLDRKLLRDLRLITGQCVTIALVVTHPAPQVGRPREFHPQPLAQPDVR